MNKTGNPVGSKAFPDFEDNVEILDVRLTSDEDTFQDRLGKSRLTWAGIEKAGSGNPAIAVDAAARAEAAASQVEQNAEQIAQDAAQQAVDSVVIAVDGAVDRAENAADRAETASDAAFVNADVYPDIATGLAAVADGEQFQVVEGDEIVRYRRGSATVSEEVARSPASSMVRAIGQSVSEVRAPLARYAGDGPIIPIVTDNQRKVLIGIDSATGNLVAGGLSQGGASVSEFLGEQNQARYHGDGPVYPIITDTSLRVLLGVDRATGGLVGSLGQSSSPPIEPRNSSPLGYTIANGDVNGVIAYGQSNSTGADAVPLISTSQPNANVTFNGGPRGQAHGSAAWDFSPIVPLIERQVDSTGESPCSGYANYASVLLAQQGISPADHVIFASTAGRGSTDITQLSKGGEFYTRFSTQLEAAASLNSGFRLVALPWIQGERDANTAATPYEAYRDGLIQLQADIETDAHTLIPDQSEPVPILCVQTNFYSIARANVARAQFDASVESDKVFIVAPTYCLPYANQIHFSNVGSKLAGAYIGRAYVQLVKGEKPDCLKPISAVASGQKIVLTFSVPCPPMRFDTERVGSVSNYGFTVADGSGSVPISSALIEGDRVILNLGRAVSGEAVVRYALDVGPNRGVTAEGGGNLRDSAPETIEILGEMHHLYNFAPAFQLNVISAGV